jgi:hypothetical protein
MAEDVEGGGEAGLEREQIAVGDEGDGVFLVLIQRAILRGVIGEDGDLRWLMGERDCGSFGHECAHHALQDALLARK